MVRNFLALDLAIRKREVVASGLQQQICEKELALQRQRENETQLAQAERNLVERFAENQQKEMRDLLVEHINFSKYSLHSAQALTKLMQTFVELNMFQVANKQDKVESKSRFDDVVRFRDEQNKQLDLIVKAEHQRLQAKEKLEMEKREQARKRLAEVRIFLYTNPQIIKDVIYNNIILCQICV